MAFTDPRIANIGVYHTYGLKDVNGKEYGEAWVREFAGLKPKLLGFNESGEVARGELHAMLGGPWRVEYNLGTVPITKICLEPGCVSRQAQLFAVVKGAPHPDAAKELIDYLLSREVEETLARSTAAQMPLHRDVAVPANVKPVSAIRDMAVTFPALGKAIDQILPYLKQWTGTG